MTFGIGRALDDWAAAHCAYTGIDADGIICGQDATWHGMVVENAVVAKSLPACDRHALVMTVLSAFIHPFEPACGLPEAVFDAETNVCRIPWDDVEVPAPAGEKVAI